jgi:hypothetical protein
MDISGFVCKLHLKSEWTVSRSEQLVGIFLAEGCAFKDVSRDDLQSERLEKKKKKKTQWQCALIVKNRNSIYH